MANWWCANHLAAGRAMPETEARSEPRQASRFLWLYALAIAGGAVSYVPFLTLLLPLRAQALTGGEAIDLLGYVAFCGAIAASLSNIAFGWASDLTSTRRPWILAGLVISASLLIFMRTVETPLQLILLIVAWQLGLNMMLGPLSAWAGDVVPDCQKGRLGGMLSLAPALGAASGALITIPGLADADTRLLLVAALVAAMVLPVLIFGRPDPMPHLMPASGAAQTDIFGPKRKAVVRMWLARLLVQIAEAALFAYLLIWLIGMEPTFTDNDTARIFASVLVLSVPAAMLCGRWSDRNDRPLVPLAIGAAIGTAGLVVMALAPSLGFAITGYFVFGLSTSVFLALHSSQTLRVLPQPATRGRDLGIFNLTNTVPSLIMPWLTITLVPLFGFNGLFAALSALAAVATVLLLTIARAK